MSELLRSNKVTTRFEGEGVVVGTFYKTHDKLGEVKSTDAGVVALGFAMPESVPAAEGVEAVEVSPKQKLDAFKLFLQTNATAFGYVYDQIDRRLDANKYPSTYNSEVLLTTATAVLQEKMTELATSLQKSVDTAVKAGTLPAGSVVNCSIGVGEVNIGEAYKNGNLKYATVKFPVNFNINGAGIELVAQVDLVSGQIKKPREFDKCVMTVTGLKGALIEVGALPKPVKKEEVAEGEDAPSADTATAAQ